MLRRYMDVEEANGVMSFNFNFVNKIERKAPSQTFRKRTTVLHGNKLDKKNHIDKSSKYAIKGN